MKDYFMYKSIMDTPLFLQECLNEETKVKIDLIAKKVLENNIKRIIVTGCGTSYMIAQAGLHFFSNIAEIEVCCQPAFELLYYPTIQLRKGDLVVGISHTGGTKAVVDLIKKCKEEGILTLSITEIVESRLDNAAELKLIGPGGKDNATPKTRSFSTGIMLLLMFSTRLAELKGLPVSWTALEEIPSKVQKTLKETEENIISLVKEWKDIPNYMIVGSGTNDITGKEISLKILEASNRMSLSTTIEELAHGNELYLSEDFGVFMLFPENCVGKERYEQIIEATKLTKSNICIISNSSLFDKDVDIKLVKFTSEISELLSIFLFVLPLQLFSYFLTVELGLNPDLSTAVHEHMRKAIEKYHPPGYH